MSGRESEEFYKQLVENASDIIAMVDNRGVLTFVNKRVEGYEGMTVQDLLGRHFSDLVHPDDLQQCAEAVAKALSGVPSPEFHFRLKLPDGSYRHLVANGSLQHIGGQEVLLAVCRDGTETFELNEKLIARNNILSALTEIAVAMSTPAALDDGLRVALDRILSALGLRSGAIVIKEAQGRLRIRSTYQASLGDLSEDAAAAARLLSDTCIERGELVAIPNTRDETVDPRMGALSDELGVEAAVSMPLRCGAAARAALTLGLAEPGGLSAEQMEFLNLAAGILGPAIENAGLHEAEQRKSLELAVLAKEARHRIKNNLQMITGLLRMSLKDPDVGGRAVQRCLRQVDALLTVHELLSQDSLSEKIRLEECLAGIAASAIQVTGRGDTVELAVTGDGCLVTADCATAVGVIVNELVNNAVEHGFCGVETGRIEVRVSHGGKMCSIEEIDDGIGLPPDFAMSKAAESARGLGLASSLATYGLGGKLEIERTERGTRARISMKGAEYWDIVS